MTDTQRNIRKNYKVKRPAIQVAQRVNGDNCFNSIYDFQNSLLLGVTSDIKNEEVRQIRMELLGKSRKYGINNIARKLIIHALETGITPEELFDIVNQ